jgi:glycerophosphoryl diester phosphodiesterase
MLFSRLPENARWLTRLPIAHRGLHDAKAGIVENTLGAFGAAAGAGYAIELDVRASAEDEAIVFHDAKLERLTAATGPLAAQNAAALRTLTLTGSGETIPALADVLALVRRRVPLLIEIKSDGVANPRLAARVQDLLRHYDGAAAIQSFEPALLRWFARHAPALPRGLLASRNRDLLTAPTLCPHFIGYDVRGLPAPLPALARRLGCPVLAWTVKDAQTEAIGRTYADNIIFEGLRPLLP